MSLLVVSLFLPCTVIVTENQPLNASVSPGQTLDLVPNAHGNIGLQNAISSLSSDLLPRKWIGTLGLSSPKMSIGQTRQLVEKLDAIDQVPVFVSDEEMDGHYNQFCKRVF